MSGGGNGTVVVERGARDIYVVVEQGPEWLVTLLYRPPEWLIFAIAGLVCLLGAGALWKLRKGGLDAETVEAIGFNLAIIGGVASSVYLLREFASLSFATDAGLGFFIGMTVAMGLRRWLIRPLVAEHWSSE